MNTRTLASNTLLLAAYLLGGCGAASSLDGSVGDSVALDFDRVRIRSQGSTLLIEYLRDIAGGSDKVCKMTVVTDDLGVAADTYLEDDTFLERVSLSRVVASADQFPGVSGGSLHFVDFGLDPAGAISGEFHALFDNGRTLTGAFSGELEVATE